MAKVPPGVEVSDVLLVGTRNDLGHLGAVQGLEREVEDVRRVLGPGLVVLDLGDDADEDGVGVGVADDGPEVEDGPDLDGGTEPDVVDDRDADPRLTGLSEWEREEND